MKRLLFIAVIALCSASLFAQVTNVPLDEYEDAFKAFAEEAAASLPFNASSIGLGWSPAYIGQFPHFGVGVTLGMSTIPYEAVKNVSDGLGFNMPSDMGFLEEMGIPIPAAVIDARLGGFFLPFDLGFKFGTIPDSAKINLGVDLDYLLVGGDVRVPLLKDKGFVPAVSVGLGYSYLNGSVTIPDAIPIGQDVDISELYGNPKGSHTNYLTLDDPDVNLNWGAHVFELKAQVSKKLFIITPFLGLGVAYGTSSVGGGLKTDTVQYNGANITQSQIDDIMNRLALANIDTIDLSSQSFMVSTDTNGWAVRAFGGMSFNIFFLKLDLNGGYNFTSGSYAASLNARVQF